jgi:hypothetical protein
MMKAARTSETSVDNYFTRQHAPLKRQSTIILHGSDSSLMMKQHAPLKRLSTIILHGSDSSMMTEAARTSETSVDNYFTR